MADFDVYQLEDCVEELLASHKRLRSENQTLRSELENHIRRNVELKERIKNILTRVETLEQRQEMAETQDDS